VILPFFIEYPRFQLYIRSGIIKLKGKEVKKMIFRIWHGWTTPENADTYESLLKKEIFPAIASQNVSGYREIHLLRRQLSEEVEFITIMQFDSLEAVKQFAGEDYEKSYVPDKARKVLSRHDDRSQHYEMKEHIMY
jgi:heme-degrading monooxygenase HmoA